MAIANDITSALARPQTLAEDWPQLARSDDWSPGQQVGPYVLKQRLGKGGMGVVWLADQLQPLQREVAIKVMAGERRDAWAETWFEVERQALAQLSHRGIAQIFDAGRLPDGALFFAMEYVPGVPLDEFQQAHPLDPRALAALFVQICAAMQHAHQRGLIHRDLKPLNVLVQMLDGEPVAKIIDFGIAVRALPGVATPFRIDRVVGTPAYMSPEQKQPGSGGIDARCDIYALGVMLGEALCRAGGPAVDRGSIDVTAVHDAVCLELGRDAHESGVASAALRPLLKRAPRELLAIAARAMSANREQRYESAAAMAEDLARWLARRPVEAIGGGRWYAFRCLIRRNRIASLAAALVLAAILGGSALAWAGMREAQRAQVLAEQRRDDAEKLIQFMLGDFADKLRPIGRLDLLDSIGHEALRYLSARDSGGDARSALSRARALRTLGEVQVTRQQYVQAGAALSGAGALLSRQPPPELLAAWHFEAGQVAFYLGAAAYRQRDLAGAQRFWNDYLEHARKFASAEPGSEVGGNEVASALNNLGTLAYERGELKSALGYFGQSVTERRRWVAGDDDPALMEMANSLSWMATVHEELGEIGPAWTARHEALAIVTSAGQSRIDATRRAREVNFRYTLALMSSGLGREEYGARILRPALRLAAEDVDVDPSQPRRLLMQAKVGLLYAQLVGPSGEGGAIAHRNAQNAMAALKSMSIDATEHERLMTWDCLLQVRSESAPPACMLQRLNADLKRDELSETEWIRLAEIFGRLRRSDREQAEALGSIAVSRWKGQSRGHFLRELLVERAFREHHLIEDDRLGQIESEIKRIRSSLPPTKEETK